LSETSVMTPNVPSAPVISRETSKPATFFITRPPKFSASPVPSITRIPRTKSRAAPAYGRRGPESPLAIAPPSVPPRAKWGGSKPSN
jgi:hypothetical protein